MLETFDAVTEQFEKDFDWHLWDSWLRMFIGVRVVGYDKGWV